MWTNGIVSSEEMLVSEKLSSKMLPALSKKENQGLGDVITWDHLYWKTEMDCLTPPQLAWTSFWQHPQQKRNGFCFASLLTKQPYDDYINFPNYSF